MAKFRECNIISVGSIAAIQKLFVSTTNADTRQKVVQKRKWKLTLSIWCLDTYESSCLLSEND